jgi:Putative phage abortive infection protein
MKIRNLSLLLIGGVCITVLIYACILLYLTWPVTEFSVAKSGVFGDSFGALTSLFSGLAFAGLIITIVMQKDELALQREELSLTRQELTAQREEMEIQNETMKIQRFENTFFKQLEFLTICRNDISHKTSENSPPLIGRNAIKNMYEKFVEDHLKQLQNLGDGYGYRRSYIKDIKEVSTLQGKYADFYSEVYGDELGQYFRTIYNILKFVDANKLISDKKIYTNLLRAQLSRYELSLLFYNCLSSFGEKK